MLALARWPGVVGLWNKPWIEWLQTGDDSLRTRAINELGAGTWELARWTWRDTTKLDLLVQDAYFSVSLFFADDNRPGGWYIDFTRPYRQTPIGVDTFDLLLDLIIEPDLSHRWKDEEEYQQGRRLGIISDADHQHVQEAREQVIALAEQRTGPFDDRWRTWHRDPAWPVPSLPADALPLAHTPDQSSRDDIDQRDP